MEGGVERNGGGGVTPDEKLRRSAQRNAGRVNAEVGTKDPAAYFVRIPPLNVWPRYFTS